ncbi:trigger factor [Alphaproteobacteria bacterium KMM 3653]|uniref:Trigger factor n=1 Tax=Harenicola maris TaxID=2841044 RepID=A0AAP2CMJ2_9RHOB|nr:trigger factor [Harenicola maris]
MPLEPHDFLARRWQLARVIEDSLTASTTRFAGQASVTETGAHWTYAETGHLYLASGQSLVAERSYLWQPSGQGVDISFPDGRAFHRMDLSGGGDHHWCDPDSYDVTYSFAHWPAWRAVWRVKGPRKDYVMTTDYAYITED